MSLANLIIDFWSFCLSSKAKCSFLARLRATSRMIFYEGSMKLIPLTQGFFTQVDDENFEELNSYKWCVLKNEKKRYAIRRKKNTFGSFIFMHRILINTPDGMFTDHIDGNGLNNQKNNLRICTKSQNACNRKAGINNVSGIKGITYDKREKKYRVRIMLNYKDYFLGYYPSIAAAKRIYDDAVKQLHREFVYTALSTPGKPCGEPDALDAVRYAAGAPVGGKNAKI